MISGLPLPSPHRYSPLRRTALLETFYLRKFTVGEARSEILGFYVSLNGDRRYTTTLSSLALKMAYRSFFNIKGMGFSFSPEVVGGTDNLVR